MLKKAKMPPSWRGFVTCVLLATVRVAMSGRTCPFIKAEQLLFDIVYIVGFCGCLFSIKDIYIYIYISYIYGIYVLSNVTMKTYPTRASQGKLERD